MRIFVWILAFLPLLASAQNRAEELFEAGQWRAAQHEFERAPRSEMCDVLLAKCAANQGHWGEALETIEAFERYYPRSAFMPEMHFLAGFCYFEEREWAKVLSSFDRAGEPIEEQRNEYFFKRGYAEFATGKDAIMTLAKVDGGEYLPHARYYLAYINYVNGHLADAKLGFKELETNEMYAPVIPYYLLQIEFQEGNYNYVTARGPAMLEQARGERKKEIERVLSEAYFHSGKRDEALESMDRYKAEGGKMGREEMYIVGFAEYEKGNHERALGMLAQVVGADDRLTQNAAYHMAAAAMELGDRRAAMQSFSIAAASDYDPKVQEDARFNNGKLQFELGGGVFNEAINVLQSFLEDYPDSPRAAEATEYLAAAYYNSRNYAEAYDAIKRVPMLDGKLRSALQKVAYQYGLSLYSQGVTDKAQAMFAESLRNSLDPKYTALAEFWTGEILAQKGEWTSAADHLKRYLAIAPSASYEHKMGLYNLGYAYFNLQQWSAACSQFEKFKAAYSKRDNFRADALNRLGDSYFALREFWKAIETYDESASLGTGLRYYSQFQRAMTFGYVDRGAHKIELLNTIINTPATPFASDALYELGAEYMSQQHYASAENMMQNYVERYPDGEKVVAALLDLGLISQNLGNNNYAITYYKQAALKASITAQAKDAVLALRNIYVAENNLDAYFDFAEKSGIETNIDAMQRDSLAWAAASGGSAENLKSYLQRYPRGQYRAEALLGYARAAADPKAWRELFETSADSAVKRQALAGYLDGDPSDAAAEYVVAQSLADGELRQRAQARLTPHEIDRLYNAGDLDGAQQLIMQFAKDNYASQHDLARAFIILGDIYARRGDSFQARATWQSIVDGYSNDLDGIVETARKKINEL